MKFTFFPHKRKSIYRKLFTSRFIYLMDGSIFSLFFERKGILGYPVDLENLKDEEGVRNAHLKFIESGANVIRTNTFNSNPIVLREFGLEKFSRDIIKKGCEIAFLVKKEKGVLIAGSMGPIGDKFFKIGREEILNSCRLQIETLIAGGVDFLLLETQVYLEEGEFLLNLIDGEYNFPVAISFSYPMPHYRTLSGHTPVDVSRRLNGRKLLLLGCNCLNRIEDVGEILKIYEVMTDFDLLVYPNAGIPKKEGNFLKYPINGSLISRYIKHDWLNYRVRMIGGCCGVTPEIIKNIEWVKFREYGANSLF